MDQKEYLTIFEKSLLLPVETRKDTIKEITSHIDNLSNLESKKMEIIMGNPKKLAKKVNRERKPNLQDLLFIKSTWIEVLKVVIFSTVLLGIIYILSFQLISLLTNGVIGLDGTGFSYMGERILFLVSEKIPNLSIEFLPILNNLTVNALSILLLFIFYIWMIVTKDFAYRQETAKRFALQTKFALFVGVITATCLVLTILTSFFITFDSISILLIVINLLVMSVLIDLKEKKLIKQALTISE